jgi:hypothetical protein
MSPYNKSVLFAYLEGVKGWAYKNKKKGNKGK